MDEQGRAGERPAENRRRAGLQRAFVIHLEFQQMNRRSFLSTMSGMSGMALGVLGLGAAAPEARSDVFDRYRRHRYGRGRDRDEIRRRTILREELFEIGDRVRLAERQRSISSREASRLYERLDDVRDFLREDRHLSESELRRRRDDLEEIEDDLRDAYRDRRHYRRRNRRSDW
jgi:hypothetical protein